MIEQAKFSFSPFRKALEKQIKAIEKQGEKQTKVIGAHEKQLVESNALINQYEYDTENDSPAFLKK